MLANAPNILHRPSLMMSRTVERFSGVRLASGNTTGETNSYVTSCWLLTTPAKSNAHIWGATLPNCVPYRFRSVPYIMYSGVQHGVESAAFSPKKASLAGAPSVSQTRSSLGRLFNDKEKPWDAFFKSGRSPQIAKDSNRCHRRQSRRMNESDRVRRHSQGV